MRVTQNMLSNNMLKNLMNSQTKLDKYMEQLYTGKKISRPSDDPVIAIKGMNYRTQVAEVEQFKRNTGEVRNWMDHSESALNESIQALQRIRELAVQASNSTYSDEELLSIKGEVEQLKSHLIELGNTKVSGKYIFNGSNTKEKPIELDDDGNIVSFPEETTPVLIEVYDSITVQANITPEKIFNEDLFNDIDLFIERLNGDEPTGDHLNMSIEDLDEAIDEFINVRADLGARMNRLELIEKRLDDQKVITTQIMSENEDVHFEEAITNLITQESLHRAALATGSRIIQPTLMDFLR